jgi:hypothetical protein
MGNKPMGFAALQCRPANPIGFSSKWLIPFAQGGLQAQHDKDTFNIELN